MATILVPIDGSALAEEAIPYARALLGPDGSLLLVRVVPAPEPLTAGPIGGSVVGADEVGAAWEQAAARELAAAAERSGLEPSRVRTDVVAGDPADEIVRLAAERGVDAIAMASRGRGALGRAIFGSVADRVARTSSVPVAIVRPKEDGVGAMLPIRRLVVPLDGSELAEAALPVAAELAARLGLPVHLVRAVDPTAALPAMPTIEPVPPISSEVADRVYQEIEASARQSLDHAAEVMRGQVRGQPHGEAIDVTQAILSGSPYFAIAAALAAGDLLVMTSHGRSGVERWLMGSVAEKLVREGPAPVLLVPAPGRTKLVAEEPASS